MTSTYFIAGYFFVFMGTVAGLFAWYRHQRKTRHPFSDELKLLRGPGESQLKLVQKFEEDLFGRMLLTASVPLLVALPILILATKLPAVMVLPLAAISLAVFVVLFWQAVRRLVAGLRERNDRYLGYFGERIVAECLEPLKAQGWRVFHDVPGVQDGHKFNLDHVAVGPQGVFVIETKTRRKAEARPGNEGHKAFFDGRVMVWPWGEDNHGLEQAERNAVWLMNTLKTELGEAVHVTPFLTLPGWWIETKQSRDSRLCRVVNPKGLAKFLAYGSPMLSPRTVEVIAAKLDARCRDVTY